MKQTLTKQQYLSKAIIALQLSVACFSAYSAVLPSVALAEQLNIDESNAAKGQPMQAAEIKQIGQQLHAALEERFNELKNSNTLPRANSQRKDVSEIMAKYLPEGTSFKTAEKILQAAGAELADFPPRPARASDPDYDRYDILGKISLWSASYNAVNVALTIRPNEQGNPDTTVLKSEGWIVIDAL